MSSFLFVEHVSKVQAFYGQGLKLWVDGSKQAAIEAWLETLKVAEQLDDGIETRRRGAR